MLVPQSQVVRRLRRSREAPLQSKEAVKLTWMHLHMLQALHRRGKIRRIAQGAVTRQASSRSLCLANQALAMRWPRQQGPPRLAQTETARGASQELWPRSLRLQQQRPLRLQLQLQLRRVLPARNPWLQWHYTQLQLPLSILNPQPQKRKLQRQRQPQLRARGLQPHLRKLQLQALLPARRLEPLHLKLQLPLLLPAGNPQVLQRSVQLPLPVSRRKPVQPQQHKPRPRPHLQPQQRKSPHPAMRPA
mmetsp:Transcript_87013/g.150579  ORF Transcript_87013/g.150579 Transcript_87013/m.150579 type:complete len:247 (-) Transcript_87013:195-935(-)